MKLTIEEIKKLEKIQLSDQELWMLRFRTKMSMAEIAELSGITRQRIHQILMAAEKKVEAQHAE